ncbi:MAG: hypothetical protein ACXW50_24280, partial [Candidatus Binatia bacterium]
ETRLNRSSPALLRCVLERLTTALPQDRWPYLGKRIEQINAADILVVIACSKKFSTYSAVEPRAILEIAAACGVTLPG